jgi:hypothetical protein
MRTLELYYSDLTPEAQEKYLKVQGVSDSSELNWEVNPIAIIEVEEDEELRKGIFVSVWDDGSSIETGATLNAQTGEVTTAQSEDTGDHGSLEREYFVDEYHNEFTICPTCHEYILKSAMDPDKVGKGLSESMVCFNPDCDSRRE